MLKHLATDDVADTMTPRLALLLCVMMCVLSGSSSSTSPSPPPPATNTTCTPSTTMTFLFPGTSGEGMPFVQYFASVVVPALNTGPVRQTIVTIAG